MPGVEMDHLDGLFASLDAQFEASIAREEDEAASDLAFSLRQGRRATELLCRSGPSAVTLSGGGHRGVSVVGRDFLAAGEPPEVAVPLRHAVVVSQSTGPSPSWTQDLFVTFLRRWARVAAPVQVDTPSGEVSGRLVAAAEDHLLLATERRWAAVGVDAVVAVRLALEG